MLLIELANADQFVFTSSISLSLDSPAPRGPEISSLELVRCARAILRLLAGAAIDRTSNSLASLAMMSRTSGSAGLIGEWGENHDLVAAPLLGFEPGGARRRGRFQGLTTIAKARLDDRLVGRTTMSPA